MKGITTCNRTACQKPLTPGATYYNNSTQANYCPHCAFLINKHNPNLCVLVKKQLDSKTTIFKELSQKLQDMHPTDGLTSPRDILLVKEINRFSTYIDEIKTNMYLSGCEISINIPRDANGQRRGLAFYKADGTNWTNEEYANIMKFVGDNNCSYDITEYAENKYIYDDGYDGTLNFMHYWNPQNIKDLTLLSYEEIFNKEQQMKCKIPGYEDINFEVGQKWINREGKQVEVIDIDTSEGCTYPILVKAGKYYNYRVTTKGEIKRITPNDPLDLISLIEESQTDKQYVVYVEGKYTPKVIHNTLEEAETEANRLATVEPNKLISVCEIISQFKSKTIVEKIK